MANLAQLFVNGLVFSSVIILSSIGLSLVYSIADFANFAHGDLLTVGAYGAVVSFGPLAMVLPDVSVFGLPLAFFAALVVGMVAAAVIAIVTEYVIYKPLNTDSIELLITSIGVAFVYRAFVQFVFGTDPTTFDVGRSGPVPWVQSSFGIAVTQRDFVIVGVTALLVLGLHALLQYTTLGQKMRATADNPELAEVTGIRTNEVIIAMWVIGGALAAAGGVFLGLDLQVRPLMGFDILLVVFAAVILGGIGSVYGAMAGGLVIGLAHELTPALPFVSTKYAPAVAFILMVAILLVKPSGIAGEGTT